MIKKFYKTGVEFSGKASILEVEAPSDAAAPAPAKKADPAKEETVAPAEPKKKEKKEARIKKAGPFTWQFFDFQNKDLEEINDDSKYTIKSQLYFADCINSNFKISNKVKQITLDGCKRVQIQVDEELVSSIEVVNCKNVTVWCMNTVPTISLEKSDCPKLFLSEKAWEKAERKP